MIKPEKRVPAIVAVSVMSLYVLPATREWVSSIMRYVPLGQELLLSLLAIFGGVIAFWLYRMEL